MKNPIKRILSMLLVLAMVVSMVPAVFAQEQELQEPTEAGYASADAVFDQIDAMEAAPAKKDADQTTLTDAAIELVVASEGYVAGSLERSGDSFTWWTEDGIHCIYSPSMRQKKAEMVAPEDPIADGAYNEPVATKGGWPSSNEVYLIGPYYGSDSNFTDQYKNEAAAIAEAIGDSDGYTLYSGTAATIDKVATAISNGAVVIFDSHGTTDYESGDDYVTGAENSYLCLTSKSGVTTEDYNDGCLYGSGYAYVNGATIANHMTSNSPAGIVWMAICLGMATDTLCEPLREMGVEVVYGYSQSVTFEGDYLFEDVFWDNMIAGNDVATSVAAMKSKWGNWDWTTTIASYYNYTDGYSTIATARANYAAFPIVVSDEDAHPGQRSGTSNYGADSLQTVQSTYTLYSQYEITATSNNTAYGTVSVSGTTITATPAEGYYADGYELLSGTATVSQNGNTFSVIAGSECEIQINFAPKTVVSVSFSGADVSAQSGYAGDSMTLPTVTASDGYTFLGWMTSPLSDETTDKPTYYTDSYIPTASTTLYALYSYVDANSGTGTGDYVKVTSTPGDWSGEYLIVYETAGYVFDSSLTTFDGKGNYQAVTITDSTISADEGDPYQFTIAAIDGGYSIQGASGYYIGNASNSNALTTGSSALVNTLSLDSTGNANIIGAGGAYLRYNNSDSRFRYYKSSSYSNQKAIALYLKDGTGGTTYYTGTPTVCEHTNTQQVAAVAATCTESGYTAGIQCSDCGTWLSGHEFVEATGHSWGQWVVTLEPDCVTEGLRTSTCESCGITQTEAVAATGHTWSDEWVVITAPTCETAGEEACECLNCSELKTQTIAATGHTWGQWEQTVAPGCETAGEETSVCADCGTTQTQAVAATGHSHTDVVTDPTASAPGYTTHTCDICGSVTVDSYTYLISFTVPGGVAPVESVVCADGGSVELPTAEVPAGGQEYVFAGWTLGAVQDATEAPVIYSGTCSFAACTTLSALYSYVVVGEDSGSGDYVKVTEEPDDWSGEYLIVYESAGYIFNGSLTTLDATNNYQAVTITDNTISADEGDPYQFIIEAVDGGYSIKSVSGYYIGRTASSNGLNTSQSTAYPHTLAIDSNGYSSVKTASGIYLRFNANSSQNRFRYYGSGQQSISLYVKEGSSKTTYYTTCVGIESASVTLESVPGVNFHAPEGYVLSVTVGTAEAVEAVYADGAYSISIPAQDMMNTVTATLCTASGTVLDTQVFTLADYVAAIIADETQSDAAKELANALLAYCQYAATAAGNYSGTCAELSAISEDAFEAHTFDTMGAPTGSSIYGYIDYGCALRIRLPEGYTATVDGIEGTSTAEILAQDYDEAHTFVIFDADGNEVYSRSFTVLAYIGQCLAIEGLTEDTANLLTALYHYHTAAEAYIAE